MIFIRLSYSLLPPRIRDIFWRIGMKLGDILGGEVINVQPDVSVKAAVELMNKYEIGCIVVKDNDEPVAIVTERDVLSKIVCQCRNPERVKVSEIMSQPLLVGNVDMSMEEAAKFMFKQNIKKLPVVDNGKLVGLITLTGIVRVDHIEPVVIKVMNQLKKDGWVTPTRLNKVVGFYI